MRNLAYRKTAAGYLLKLPANRRDNIRGKIAQVAATGLRGEQENNIKALENRPGHYRLRVGDYRVIFEIDDATLTILDVWHRGKGY